MEGCPCDSDRGEAEGCGKRAGSFVGCTYVVYYGNVIGDIHRSDAKRRRSYRDRIKEI